MTWKYRNFFGSESSHAALRTGKSAIGEYAYNNKCSTMSSVKSKGCTLEILTLLLIIIATRVTSLRVNLALGTAYYTVSADGHIKAGWSKVDWSTKELVFLRNNLTTSYMTRKWSLATTAVLGRPIPRFPGTE